MKISFLISSDKHPVNQPISDWIKENSDDHEIDLIRSKEELKGGFFLFLVSCNEIVEQEYLELYNFSLVLHASKLPQGRGWSPHVWQIIEGKSFITVSLLEAGEKVDSGKIWKQMDIEIPKNALWQEINHNLFKLELALIDYAINNFEKIKPFTQGSEKPTYYRKRTPEDSELDPSKSIESQFDLMRVCDDKRFPAFFNIRGRKFFIKIETEDE